MPFQELLSVHLFCVTATSMSAPEVLVLLEMLLIAYTVLILLIFPVYLMSLHLS